MKRFYRIGIFLFTGYFLMGLFLFFNQKAFIYFPTKQDFQSCAGFLEFEKNSFKGTRFYYQKNNSKKVLVYYHGNAGSTCDREFTKNLFLQTDYSLIFVEYTGYSNDKKDPSFKGVLENVKKIDNFIKAEKFQKVVVYGQSLGAAAASFHASLGNVNGVILVSPFRTLKELAQSIYKIYPMKLLLTEKYDNSQWLENFQGKTLILHGEKDKVIPPKFSKKLFAEIKSRNKKYILIKNKNHNNIWTSNVFQKDILDFLKK